MYDCTTSPINRFAALLCSCSLLRPTTRTTKTISDGSESSRSSVLLEKTGLGGLGRAADTSGDNVDSFLRGEHGHHTVESYISFQSDIRWVDWTLVLQKAPSEGLYSRRRPLLVS